MDLQLLTHNKLQADVWAEQATSEGKAVIAMITKSVDGHKIDMMASQSTGVDTLIEHLENLTRALKDYQAKKTGIIRL